MPTVSGDDGMLEKALKDLEAAWAATEGEWRDRARSAFAEEHLAEIQARTRLALRAMRQVETLLKEAVNQCS